MSQVEQKLHAIIESGKTQAAKGMEALVSEYNARKDYIVKPSAIQPIVEGNEFKISLQGQNEPFALTQHSRGQFLQRIGMPQNYADGLLGGSDELKALFSFSAEKLLSARASEGVLVRAVDQTVKGWLSPSYRRMDAQPLFETFLRETLGAGMVPQRAEVTESRAFISMIVPKVAALRIGSEVDHVVFGAQFRTSDYGRGAAEMDVSILRLLCLNGMMGFDLFRKIHIGKRFDAHGDSSSVISLSNRTINLDTATVRSAMKDTVKTLPAHLGALQESLEANGGREVNLANAMASLRKRGVKAAVIEKVKSTYETELPVEALPQTSNVWRLSNVLSLLANSEQGDSAQDLRDVAFETLGIQKLAA